MCCLCCGSKCSEQVHALADSMLTQTGNACYNSGCMPQCCMSNFWMDWQTAKSLIQVLVKYQTTKRASQFVSQCRKTQQVNTDFLELLSHQNSQKPLNTKHEGIT